MIKDKTMIPLVPLLSALLIPSVSRARHEKPGTSLSAIEISEAALAEGRAVSGIVVEVRSILPDVGQRGGLLFVTLDGKQWRISFVELEAGQAKLAWVSEPFTSPFEETISNQSLEIVPLGNETVARFRGCAEHMCPDVFGVALFRLSDGKPFTAKVNRLKGETVEYSSDVLRPEFKGYNAAWTRG